MSMSSSPNSSPSKSPEDVAMDDAVVVAGSVSGDVIFFVSCTCVASYNKTMKSIERRNERSIEE